jgi:putative transcriptional regulator
LIKSKPSNRGSAVDGLAALMRQPRKRKKGGERMNVPKEETKLKRILREKGIKQTFVADKMGVNVRKINDYVNGRTLLKLDVAIKIANILNIDVKELA